MMAMGLCTLLIPLCYSPIHTPDKRLKIQILSKWIIVCMLLASFFWLYFKSGGRLKFLFCNAMRYFFPIKNLAALFNVKNIDNEKGKKKMYIRVVSSSSSLFQKNFVALSLFSIRFNMMMMMTHTELAAALATTTTITNNHYRPKWRQFGY